jgi:hypothetical protein
MSEKNKKRTYPDGYPLLQKLRPHLAIAKDLGWTSLEMRNFMWSRGKLRMKGATREQILAVLAKAKIPYTQKAPARPQQALPAPTPAPPASLPVPQKPTIPPMPRDPPKGSTILLTATRPTRSFRPEDVKRAIDELEQFQKHLLSRLNMGRPGAVEASSLVFVIRILGYLRGDV